jgi:hypothetical protein
MDSYTCAAWLPDAKHFFIAATRPGHAVQGYIAELEETYPRAMTPEGIDPYYCPATPDGHIIALVNPYGKLTLYTTDTGAIREFEGLRGYVPIRWDSTGSMLYIYSLSDEPTAVYRLDVASEDLSLWKVLSPADPVGITGIFDIALSPDARSYAFAYYRDLSEVYISEGIK